jgi:Putative mono-oxygenase ydhR
MKNAEAVLSVKFNSAFGAEKFMNVCQEDLKTFRSVPGLVQKYYIAEENTGALSGIYIFEDRKARETFWNSAIAKAIPTRYGIIPETLRVEQYDMAIVLNEVLIDC